MAVKKGRNLVFGHYSAAYKGRLLEGLVLLTTWLASRNWEGAQKLTASKANALLIQFVQHLFDAGNSLSQATHGLLAFPVEFIFG